MPNTSLNSQDEATLVRLSDDYNATEIEYRMAPGSELQAILRDCIIVAAGQRARLIEEWLDLIPITHIAGRKNHI